MTHDTTDYLEPRGVAPSSPGAKLIAAERQRQQDKEGYDRAHDTLEHPNGEIWRAGVAYATGNRWWWPWEPELYKPEATSEEQPTLRDLVKAGALIAAEIDRVLYAQHVVQESRRDGGWRHDG